MGMPPTPSPSPPPSPKPSKLPALSPPPNIASMFPLSRRLSLPSRPVTLSPRSSVPPPSTPSPRLPAKPELPKLLNTPPLLLSDTMVLTLDKHLNQSHQNCNLDK